MKSAGEFVELEMTLELIGIAKLQFAVERFAILEN
jgi:hypothetical protein